MRRTVLILIAGLVLALTHALAEDVKFSAKPSITKSGDQSTISFALSAPGDVEVCILDASGKVVRHLVAGVLGGKNNPPEPLKPGLSQNVPWDGKDDSGKTASGGPFKAQISAGMKPQLDGFLLNNPAASGMVSALAVGPQGNVYIFHRDPTPNALNSGSIKLKVLNRDGKHVRALMPFPADIAPDKVKAFGVFQTKDGELVPRVHNWMQLSFYPDPLMANGHSMPEGCCPAVNSKGRIYWLIHGPSLVALDAEGGAPFDSFVGPKLFPDIKNIRMGSRFVYQNERPPCLAVSGDDKYVYISDLCTGDDKSAQPIPCVFRVDAEKRGPAEVFAGKPGQPGGDKELLTSPRGLAVVKGLLYVADCRADRVAIFKEADHSYVGEIKVKAPDSIGVDPATETLYVCSLTNITAPELIKFDKTGKALYRTVLPAAGSWAKEGVHRIAVDASAKPVRIWMPSWPYAPAGLFCIEDTGDKFVDKGDPRSKEPWAEGPRDITMNRAAGELYFKVNGQAWHRYDEKTEKMKDSLNLGNNYPEINQNAHGTQLVPVSDGSLCTLSWGVGLLRFDHEGKPLNWPEQSSNKIALPGIMCFQERHLALFKPEEIWMVANPALIQGAHDSRFTSVNQIGPDGKVKRTVIWQCMLGAVPRLDAKGNIYLAEMVKPPNQCYPEFFDGKLPATPKTFANGVGGDAYWTSYMYGSIIKFPPSGGIIWYNKDLPVTAVGKPSPELLAQPKISATAHIGYQTQCPADLQGALWYRFGYAPYSCTSTTSTDSCMCEGGGFDVDPYGRVFFPNLGQFRIEVIDTNNNPIGTFGAYGNQDSGGPDATVKKPAIPFAWPNNVTVSDTHAYVADTLNRRVVKVKLTYSVVELCPIQ
jgi:hypothetical protein